MKFYESSAGCTCRLYGTYEHLHTGFTTKALQDLTGGIVQSFSLSQQDKFLTYQVLNSAVPRSTLLIASISSVGVSLLSVPLLPGDGRRSYPTVSRAGQRRQATSASPQRIDVADGVQRDGTGSSAERPRRNAAGAAAQPVRTRRVERPVVGTLLGVGLALRTRQGAAQHSRAQRRRILVRATVPSPSIPDRMFRFGKQILIIPFFLFDIGKHSFEAFVLLLLNPLFVLF